MHTNILQGCGSSKQVVDQADDQSSGWGDSRVPSAADRHAEKMLLPTWSAPTDTHAPVKNLLETGESPTKLVDQQRQEADSTSVSTSLGDLDALLASLDTTPAPRGPTQNANDWSAVGMFTSGLS